MFELLKEFVCKYCRRSAEGGLVAAIEHPLRAERRLCLCTAYCEAIVSDKVRLRSAKIFKKRRVRWLRRLGMTGQARMIANEYNRLILAQIQS
jgi:hypothetical protein